MNVPAASPAGSRWSLRRRLVVGLLAYLMLLTLGVLANDFIVNERAENLVWQSLLEAEFGHFMKRRQENPDYRWEQTETLEMFELQRGTSQAPQLQALAPGIHDEIVVDGRERVVLVRDEGQMRHVLALDIRDLEDREARIRSTVFASAFVSVLLLGLMAAWGADRLTRPLKALARQIGSLSPETGRSSVSLPENASAELAVIVEAMNGYGRRIESFVEREREFVAMASHELRTPLSVIDGAVKLSLAEPGLPEAAERRLRRVQGTLDDVGELVAMLLALARNPERLAEGAEPLSLHRLVAGLVEQFEPLARGKGLAIVVGPLPDTTISAPAQMAQAAIGNLLRNAIENTHGGEIRVRLEAPAAVVIENPAQQADLAELARAYTRLARGGGRDGGGIGLSLITRLCAHCGWALHFRADAGAGVHFTLDFAPR